MSRQFEVMALFVAVLCLIVDAGARRVRRLRGYEVGDTLCSVLIGLSGLVAWIIARVAVLAVGFLITQHLPTLTLVPDGIAGWMLTLLGVDFGYYWYHRLLHRTNVGWAMHSVHHSSPCFNYATALRGSFAEPFIEPWFHVWLLFLGAEPLEVVGAMTVNHLYQFCLHTESVGRLKWVGWLFVTPSDHRVHHASNDEYLDRNFGAMLNIWDHLFGSFRPEVVQPEYGLVNPILSNAPLTVIMAPLAALVRSLQARPSLRARLSHLVARPDEPTTNMEYPL